MKNLKVSIGIAAMAVLSLTAVACKSEKKEAKKTTEVAITYEKTTKINNILTSYLALKNDLTKDNSKAAAAEGKKLYAHFVAFDSSTFSTAQQKTLADIIADAKESAEHIGKSEMPHQREHFKILSKDLIDMIAITGTPTKLYEQVCPMYKKGSAWLSADKNVVNPYYGSKMLTCGFVKKEINEKS